MAAEIPTWRVAKMWKERKDALLFDYSRLDIFKHPAFLLKGEVALNFNGIECLAATRDMVFRGNIVTHIKCQDHEKSIAEDALHP